MWVLIHADVSKGGPGAPFTDMDQICHKRCIYMCAKYVLKLNMKRQSSAKYHMGFPCKHNINYKACQLAAIGEITTL